MKKIMTLLKSQLIAVFFSVFFSPSANAQTLNITAITTAACNGDGSMFVTISGGNAPYNDVSVFGPPVYLKISSLTDTFTLNNLVGGWYKIYIYDSGQYGLINVYVKAPFDTLIVSSTPENCSNSDGTASVSVTGGTPPYSYLWTNGATTQSITGLTSGGYDVEVTDAAGCKYKASYFGDSLGTDGTAVWVGNNSPITLSTSFTNDSCGGNGTATVNPSGGTAPYSYYWKDAWNSSFPVQTTQTAVNLPSSYYSVKVTDASGCYKEAWVYVSKATSYYLFATSTPESCNNSDGIINANASGGIAPYQYSLDGITFQSSNIFTGLKTGGYTIVAKDANNCLSQNVWVNVFNSSPINLSLTSTNATCGNADGSATVSPTSGTSPYTYQWSDGQTTQTAIGLKAGWYSVTVTDANSCKKEKVTYVWESWTCFAQISGTVYEDKNGNCLREANEKGLPTAMVKLFSSSGQTRYYYTDTSGTYFVLVDSGTYTISLEPHPYWNQICPVSPGTYSVTLSAGSSSTGNDFGVQLIPGKQDLRISSCVSRLCTGFDHYDYIRCYNVGTVPMLADVTFSMDNKLTFLSATPSPLSFIPNTAQWQFNLDYMSRQDIVIRSNVPTSVFQGEILYDSIMISPVTGDLTPNNNKYNWGQVVSCAVDPNEIEVTPKGQTSSGNITVNDTILTYTVRFQNTGTDTAFTVVVRDTLDASLDIITFQEGASSHPYKMQIEKDNILVFTFDNILLPDSNVNEQASHGVFNYEIKLKKNLPIGTQIKNSGAIYFDFNQPVITNTVVNTLFDPTGIKEYSLTEKNSLSVHPNPFAENTTLNYSLQKNTIVSLEVFNVLGEKVKTILNSQNQNAGSYNFNLNGKDLNENFYLVKLSIDGKVSTKKVLMVR